MIAQRVNVLAACLRKCALRVQNVELRAGAFVVANLCNLERTLCRAHVVDLRVENSARGAQVGPGGADLQLDLAAGFGFRFAGFAATRFGFIYPTLCQETIEQRPESRTPTSPP